MNENKTSRPGIYIQGIIFTLIFIIFGALLPTDGGNKILPLLVFITWSLSNYFCRLTGRRFAAGCLSGIFIATIGSLGLSADFSYLYQIDVFLAERWSYFTIGSTGKILVLLGVCCGIYVMNIVIDSINNTIVGRPGFFKKVSSFAAGLIGPAVAIVLVAGGSKIQNKIEEKKTDTLITYATTKAPSQDKVEVVKGTDWRYSSLPQDVLEEIKTFENAPLVTGKIKISILAPDPLKPGVIQVGYGITDMEIKEAIHYGFLPKGSKLPKRLTKEEADKWFENITIPTYLAQVKEVVNPKIKLNGYQVIGLYSFCHNLGKENLKSLLDGRLNSGNMKGTLDTIGKYCNVIKIIKGKKVKIPYNGLKARRAWEKKLLEMETIPPAALEPPTLLVTKR